MLKLRSYCLFETPLGRCGIAWTDARAGSDEYAVTHFQLPESTPGETESRIARKSGAAGASEPPRPIATLIARVSKHLQGEIQDFRDVPVDLATADPFVRRICQAVREIPAGKTVTYAELAKVLGDPSLTRAVGGALGRNPIPLIIPCHRVQAAGGKPGGFSAHGGRVTKAKLLAIEGAVVNLCLEFGAQE